MFVNVIPCVVRKGPRMETLGAREHSSTQASELSFPSGTITTPDCCFHPLLACFIVICRELQNLVVRPLDSCMCLPFCVFAYSVTLAGFPKDCYFQFTLPGHEGVWLNRSARSHLRPSSWFLAHFLIHSPPLVLGRMVLKGWWARLGREPEGWYSHLVECVLDSTSKKESSENSHLIFSFWPLSQARAKYCLLLKACVTHASEVS